MFYCYLQNVGGITLHIYLFPHSPNPFLTYGQMRQKCAFRLGAINHLNALTACLISGRLTKEGVGVWNPFSMPRGWFISISSIQWLDFTQKTVVIQRQETKNKPLRGNIRALGTSVHLRLVVSVHWDFACLGLFILWLCFYGWDKLSMTIYPALRRTSAVQALCPKDAETNSDNLLFTSLCNHVLSTPVSPLSFHYVNSLTETVCPPGA